MRDYANNHFKAELKKKSGRQNKKTKSRLIVGIVIFAILFLFGLYWLQQHPAPAKAPVKTASNQLKPHDALIAKKNLPKPQDHFDFYTMLPQQQVPVNFQNSPSSSSPARAPEEFFLQIGAFADLATADGLKAKLTLAGFTAKIQPKQVDGQLLYRVYLGPYASARERDEQKSALSAYLAQSAVDTHKLPP